MIIKKVGARESKRSGIILPWVVLSALVIGVVGPALAEEQTDTGMTPQTLTEMRWFVEGHQGDLLNPGHLKMFVYVPESVQSSPQPRPLVVALHGCAMTAEDYFVATGWGQLAEKWNFALLLPEVQKLTLAFNFLGMGNPAVCFGWWESDRGNIEVRSIMNMIKNTLDANPNLDPGQIYVTGVSAGGSMTVDLLALHPACFAGGGSIAGVPFNCSENDVTQAISDCMQPTSEPSLRPRHSIDEGGKGYSAQRWGSYVRRVCRDNRDCPAEFPPISIVQGKQDRMVAPGNMRDLRRQWTNVHGIDEDADNLSDTTVVPPYVIYHHKYADRNGRVRVETRLIGEEGPATDHGVVIDPEDPTFRCGRTQEFVYDGNICSTLEFARFFGLEDQSTGAERARGRCAALQKIQ